MWHYCFPGAFYLFQTASHCYVIAISAILVTVWVCGYTYSGNTEVPVSWSLKDSFQFQPWWCKPNTGQELHKFSIQRRRWASKTMKEFRESVSKPWGGSSSGNDYSGWLHGWFCRKTLLSLFSFLVLFCWMSSWVTSASLRLCGLKQASGRPCLHLWNVNSRICECVFVSSEDNKVAL